MKKGEMTITTIIAIVLAVVILVFLIYGFSTGWGNFWSRVNIFGGGKANVNDVAQACLMACQNQDAYGFCNMERTITLEDGSKVSYITNKDEEETESYEPEYLKVNCNTLATNENLGLKNIFEECPNLC